MSSLHEIDTEIARAKIRDNSKKQAYKARKKFTKYKNAQINLRKRMYNSVRTKHK